MMLNEDDQVKAASRDLERSSTFSDYEAVDVLWVAIIRVANLEDAQSEHKRFLALLDRLPAAEIAGLLAAPSVDALLDLDPPLESIRSFVHERLDVQRTADELASVRDNRASEPKVALASLAETLKRIRNRRAHGFKTPDGPRDQVVLGAATDILRKVCGLAIRLRT
jgi:hypothetical protein